MIKHRAKLNNHKACERLENLLKTRGIEICESEIPDDVPFSKRKAFRRELIKERAKAYISGLGGTSGELLLSVTTHVDEPWLAKTIRGRSGFQSLKSIRQRLVKQMRKALQDGGVPCIEGVFFVERKEDKPDAKTPPWHLHGILLIEVSNNNVDIDRLLLKVRKALLPFGYPKDIFKPNLRLSERLEVLGKHLKPEEIDESKLITQIGLKSDVQIAYRGLDYGWAEYCTKDTGKYDIVDGIRTFGFHWEAQSKRKITPLVF
ncbi:hypothetical protein [Grimontia hollisae]|uniref:hypothetical protein n=1 Tax=Grimontia hollisae TaxID=673 RepID=UPI00165D65AA|nr:hypothetical protein [Grimontia hollisae]